jgi:hypothetical protein
MNARSVDFISRADNVLVHRRPGAHELNEGRSIGEAAKGVATVEAFLAKQA